MKRNFKLILSYIAVVAVCTVIAFLLHGWLGDSVFPVHDYYDSYEWADIFGIWYVAYAVVQTILNIIFILLHNSKTPQRRWLSMIIIDFIVSVTSFIPFFLIYPLDGALIYFIATCGLAILTGPGAFYISTLFAPWDFHPNRIK